METTIRKTRTYRTGKLCDLPIRDGNWDGWRGETTPTGLCDLPIRDGNLFSPQRRDDVLTLCDLPIRDGNDTVPP